MTEDVPIPTVEELNKGTHTISHMQRQIEHLAMILANLTEVNGLQLAMAITGAAAKIVVETARDTPEARAAGLRDMGKYFAEIGAMYVAAASEDDAKKDKDAPPATAP